jgi:isopenicillin N synthase-like dioxygenase
VHGKSRYPGLSIWTRDGTKMEVKVPEGCLLIQAAKQLEWLTGGDIEAGFHEVVVSDKTLASIEKAKAAGKSNLWRVSSTLFSQMRYDSILEPLEQFSTAENLKKYPPTLTYEQVEEELRHIGLLKTNDYDKESAAQN